MNECYSVILFLKQSCISYSLMYIFCFPSYFSFITTAARHTAVAPYFSAVHTSNVFPVLEILIFLLASGALPRFTLIVKLSCALSRSSGWYIGKKWIPYDRHYATAAHQSWLFLFLSRKYKGEAIFSRYYLHLRKWKGPYTWHRCMHACFANFGLKPSIYF